MRLAFYAIICILMLLITAPAGADDLGFTSAIIYMAHTNNRASTQQFLPASDARPTPEEMGHYYDEEKRKAYKLPLEWFACNATADCDLVKVPCSTSLAVGKTHKKEAQMAICGQAEGCAASCNRSLPDTSVASCDNGECKTTIQSFGKQ